jgi:predicted dehydrogenase
LSRLRAAVIGTGFMGRVHLEAIRRVGSVEPYAVCGTSLEKARALADAYGVEKAESDYERVIKDPAVDTVHICTPNDSHASIAAAALAANKHVICEKPLATKTEDAAKLVALARDRHRRNCTCHNLRYYPMVQQMRRMCEVGELGEILVVRGTYSQDWLLYDTDWNWRVDASKAGPSRAMADIGTHWCDMVEHITDQRIVSVCADLATFHKTRKRPDPLQRAISAVDVPVETEDFGAVLFRLGDRGRGAVTVSQVSAGRKNRLSLEISGTKAAVAWNQERPDELWIGSRNRPNQLLLKDPTLLQVAAASYVDLPGGHSEGYDDTFKQVFRRFYRSIEDPGAAAEYPQFEDGLRQMRVLDAVRTSHQRRTWVDVE